jgi:tRNA U34 5-methylaminomethyl-2-thiouridine-forming methyltransferase MnmC
VQIRIFAGMKREIIVTADGSKTIYLPEWNEHYHSSHGALQEAHHVFIKHGLTKCTEDYITILEMGFGTGLNAFLTYFASEKRHQYVHYIGVEVFPPSEEEWKAMDYSQYANDPDAESVYEKMHQCVWELPQELSEHFVLEKRQKTIQEMSMPAGSVDLIYYDAFGPRVQPELWSLEVFQKMFDWLSPGGIFVTYCAKGQVKRDLKSAGFLVESLPGPPGKREMTRAIKVA